MRNRIQRNEGRSQPRSMRIAHPHPQPLSRPGAGEGRARFSILCDRTSVHDATFVRAGLPNAFSRAAISDVMKRAVIGVPS